MVTKENEMVKNVCGRLNNGPPIDVHIPIPRTCVYVILQVYIYLLCM